MSWREPGASRLVGRRVPRVDGPAKVKGEARYSFDVRLPGMLYARILTCPHPHARIRSVDLAAAKRMPGVRAVIAEPGREIRFQGDWVVALAAESEELAEDALRTVRVTYQELPFVVTLDAGLEPSAPRVFERQSNLQPEHAKHHGDPAAALERADVTVELTLETQSQVHTCLEPHGWVAHWQKDGSLTVYASTQGVTSTQDQLASYLKLEPAQVRVICDHMGGGFGSKMGAGPLAGVCCRLAREANAPVKLFFDRPTELVMGGNRPPSRQVIRAGATRDGKLSGLAIGTQGTAGIGSGSYAWHPYVYAIDDYHVEHVEVRTHLPPSCPFRGPSMPQGCFGMESVMDALAYELKMDPLAFRLINDHDRVRRAQFELGAKAIGWSDRASAPGASTGTVKRGTGVAATMWWGNGGPGNTVTVTIAPDGRVEAEAATQDLGTGTRTLLAAIVAEELGLPIEAVTPRIGDTAFGRGTGSGGSTTAASVAPAALLAAQSAARQLLDAIAPKLGAAPADLELSDGQVRRKSGKGEAVPFAKAAGLLGTRVRAASGWKEGLSGSMVAGCQFAAVAVDTLTGKIAVEKIVAVQDCGKVLDRLTCETQVHGGVIQGISFALLEERIIDRRLGRMINQRLDEYKIAGFAEVPPIEVILQDMPERGPIGIGEPTTIPTAAAIANAVYHAIGVRMTALPMTPMRVLEALAGARR